MSSKKTMTCGNKKHRCLICGTFYSAKTQNDIFMARFPTEVVRCRKWLKVVGNPRLLHLPAKHLGNRYVCGKHFTSNDYNRKKSRLKSRSVPSQLLSRPPLDDDLVKKYPIEEILEPRKKTGYKPTKFKLSRHCITDPLAVPDVERIKQLSEHDHKYSYLNAYWPYRDLFSPDSGRELVLHDHSYLWGFTRGENELKHTYDPKIPRRTIRTRRTRKPSEDDYEDLNEAFQDDNDFDDTRQSKEKSDLVGDCTDIEYLEEDEAADSDDSTDMKRRQDTYSPSKMVLDQNFKLTLDDIDLLFLSYAKTFRSLAKQFQTMLKLDIAKLFTRYEQKNASLGSQDASKPAESPTPAEETQPSVQPQTAPVKPVPPDLVPPQPKFDLTPENPFAFSNDENKRTYRRVPIQAVPPKAFKVAQAQVTQAKIPSQAAPSEVLKVTQAKVPSQAVPSEVIKVSQVTQAKIPSQAAPSEVLKVAQVKPAAVTPDTTIMQLPPGSRIRAAIPGGSGRKLLFVSPQGKILRPLIRPKSIVKPASGNVSNLNPTVGLERINILSGVQDALSASKMKFVVPKKGPAYAIMSKESVEQGLEREEEEPKEEVNEEDTGDQEMDVHTETVFVATHDNDYSDVET